jgi:signal transduction histidine kinase
MEVVAIKKPSQRPESAAALRKRALQQLPKQSRAPGLPATKPQLSQERLLHELHVYQIELELQNEELKRGKADAELYLANHTALYDSAPVGYFTLSAEGLIKQVNITGAGFVGVERARLIGQPFVRLISAVLQPSFIDFLQQIFAGPSKRSADFELDQETPPPRQVNIKGKRLLNGVDCQLVMVDITERKRAETALLHSKAMLSTLIAQAPLGIFVVGSTFCLQQINPAALPVFSSAHPLIGRDFAEVLHQAWSRPEAHAAIEAVVAHFRHTLATGEPYRSPELAQRRSDDHIKGIYEWQIQRVTLPAGDLGVVCFFTDVTERIRAQQAIQRLDLLAAANTKLRQEIVRRQAVEKALTKSESKAQKNLEQSRHLQEKLRRLSRNIIRMQEDQRRDISKELHDGISQLLVGINVQLATFAKRAALDPKSIPKGLAPVYKLVTKSVHVLHQFARELRPAMLDELGLIPALRSYLEDFPKQRGLEIEFSAKDDLRELDTDRRTVLYRVAQESLSNVARHANATQVRIAVSKARGNAILVIADDGHAFDVNQINSPDWINRLGLSHMRERVEMVGGRFTVTSTPELGTKIRAVVPLR